MKKPEFIHVGDTILFREGRTRGKGKIIKLYPLDLTVDEKEKKNSQMKKQRFNEPKKHKEQKDNHGKNSINMNQQKKKEG